MLDKQYLHSFCVEVLGATLLEHNFPPDSSIVCQYHHGVQVE